MAYIRCIFGFGYNDAVLGSHPAEYRYKQEGEPDSKLGSPMCEKCAAELPELFTAVKTPVEKLPEY